MGCEGLEALITSMADKIAAMQSFADSLNRRMIAVPVFITETEIPRVRMIPFTGFAPGGGSGGGGGGVSSPGDIAKPATEINRWMLEVVYKSGKTENYQCPKAPPVVQPVYVPKYVPRPKPVPGKPVYVPGPTKYQVVEKVIYKNKYINVPGPTQYVPMEVIKEKLVQGPPRPVPGPTVYVPGPTQYQVLEKIREIPVFRNVYIESPPLTILVPQYVPNPIPVVGTPLTIYVPKPGPPVPGPTEYRDRIIEVVKQGPPVPGPIREVIRQGPPVPGPPAPCPPCPPGIILTPMALAYAECSSGKVTKGFVTVVGIANPTAVSKTQGTVNLVDEEKCWEYETVRIPYVECGENGPTLQMMDVLVKKGSLPESQIEKLRKSADLAMLGCVTQGRLTIPESWASRIGKERPVLSILYREKGSTWGDYYTVINIPHYDKPKGHKPNFPKFQKGSYFSVAHLEDGSKIVINANSEAEANRVLNALVQYTGQYKSTAKITSGKRKTSARQVSLVPIRADFYPNGLQGVMEWSIDLSGYKK